VPRKIGRPSRCPKCMSPLWDKEYQRKVAGAERADERKRQFNRMIEGLKAKAKKSARAKDL
jgi:hypothetical protein